jgi:hypothetical protein
MNAKVFLPSRGFDFAASNEQMIITQIGMTCEAFYVCVFVEIQALCSRKIPIQLHQFLRLECIEIHRQIAPSRCSGNLGGKTSYLSCIIMI